jgi:hypothetical protein
MSNELSPFERWMAANGYDPKSVDKAKRKVLGDEYLRELVSKHPLQNLVKK